MSELASAALIRKRAELAGEIAARSAALDQLRADLVHLDAAIRIMCPEAEPELIRPKKPSRKGCDWFGRQELPRLVLASLRGATQPLSPAEIAQAVMTCKGMVVDAMAPRRVAGIDQGCAAPAAWADGGEGRQWAGREVAGCCVASGMIFS